MRDGRAADAHLPQRPVRIAHEEPGHDRLLLAVSDAPVVEPLRRREALHADARARDRVADDIDGRLLAVTGAQPQQLVGAAIVGRGPRAAHTTTTGRW